MKKILLLAILALALPTAMFAGSSVDYTNSGGTLSGSSSGLSLERIGPDCCQWAERGRADHRRKPGQLELLNRSASQRFVAEWRDVRRWCRELVYHPGNGSNGIPSGVLFTGTFDGPVTWTLVTLANGTHNYTLTGSVSGWTGSGAPTEGATVQLTINTGKGFFNGSTTISSGDTNVKLLSRARWACWELG